MKNRNRQRANRRMKEAGLLDNTKIEKPWLNHEGYHDPTAYEAIRNVQRQERRIAQERRDALQHRPVARNHLAAAMNP